jgi:hypothetical protein
VRFEWEGRILTVMRHAMKITVTLLLIVLFYVQSSFGQDTFLVFPKEIDFGIIYQDTVKTRRVNYPLGISPYNSQISEEKYICVKNLSDKPLIISDVNWGSNDCPPGFSKKPILKGDSSFISLFCNINYEKKFDRNLTIHTSQGHARVRYKGEVCFMPHFIDISQNDFRIGRIYNNEDIPEGRVMTLHFEIKNVSDKLILLKDFHGDSLIKVSHEEIALSPHQSRQIYFKLIAEMPTNCENCIGNDFLSYSKMYFSSICEGYNELVVISIDAVITRK